MLFLKTVFAVVPQLMVVMALAFQESILSLVAGMLLERMSVAPSLEHLMDQDNAVVHFRYINT